MSSLLDVVSVVKTYAGRGGDVMAVRGVDLAMTTDETLALVGESGCGKSTLGRMVVGLARPTSGRIRVDGGDPAESSIEQRRRVQMVFQHPKQSLNPRFTVEQTIEEPQRFLLKLPTSQRSDRIGDLLDQVGLDRSFRDRQPGRLSGGQQQRVAIARALASEPDLVVLDEPTSALDQSVRTLIMDLLGTIQRDRHVSYLLITHDLESAKLIAHRAAVMYLGRIVELGSARQVFGAPVHPYTTALLAAAPTQDPDMRGSVIPLNGETPDPRLVTTGCAFADRCRLVRPSCRQGTIGLERAGDGHLAACPVVLGTTAGASAHSRILDEGVMS